MRTFCETDFLCVGCLTAKDVLCGGHFVDRTFSGRTFLWGGRFVDRTFVEGRFLSKTFCREGHYVAERFVLLY